ncbi:MAG TPA: hypothetical protein VG847_16900 [Chitinophagaceae bacterium]|nr:hypothetical protein [Chitinophagaceae bacterium]
MAAEFFVNDEGNLESMREELERQRLKAELEHNAMLEKVRSVLLEYYAPATYPMEADFHFTTNEIWKQLLNIYPNEVLLTKDTVAAWMHAGGFRLFDFGEMRFEWLIKIK